MSHIVKEKQKLVARIKRIRGQVDAIERSLTQGDDCADVLMLLANVRGGISSLMAEVLEDHIRLHLLLSSERIPLRVPSWPKTSSIWSGPTSSSGYAAVSSVL